MNNIKVGDRVQFHAKHPKKGENPIKRGRVITIHGGRKPWAGIRLGDGSQWVRDLSQLTLLSDTDLVAAVQAQPQDDQDREDVIAALMNAGSLGGAL